MENGEMFSILEKYLDEDFLNSHLLINISTMDNSYLAKIFSVYTNDVYVEESTIIDLDLESKVQFYKNMSIYDLEIEGELKSIIKLVTCYYKESSTKTTQRIYIVANLI